MIGPFTFVAPGWIRGFMLGRFYVLLVSDDYKRFITIGFNKANH